MRSRNPVYPYACFFAVLFAICGIILLYEGAVGDTKVFPRLLAGIFLITFSGWFTWRLSFHSVLDWIIVPCMVSDQRVAFSRKDRIPTSLMNSQLNLRKGSFRLFSGLLRDAEQCGEPETANWRFDDGKSFQRFRLPLSLASKRGL